MLFNSCLDALAHSVTEVVGFSFLSSNVLKNLANCCCHFVMKKPEIDLVDSNSVCNHTSDYQTRTNARRESHLSIMTMILDRIRRNEVHLPNTHSYYIFLLSIFCFFFLIPFYFNYLMKLPLLNYYHACCDKKHINSEIYLLRVTFDNSLL